MNCRTASWMARSMSFHSYMAISSSRLSSRRCSRSSRGRRCRCVVLDRPASAAPGCATLNREHLAGRRALLGREVGDQRRDLVGRERVELALRHAAPRRSRPCPGCEREPGAGDRGDRVDAYAVPLELVGGDQGQCGDGRLGGAVVGLAGVGHRGARTRDAVLITDAGDLLTRLGLGLPVLRRVMQHARSGP